MPKDKQGDDQPSDRRKDSHGSSNKEKENASHHHRHNGHRHHHHSKQRNSDQTEHKDHHHKNDKEPKHHQRHSKDSSQSKKSDENKNEERVETQQEKPHKKHTHHHSVATQKGGQFQQLVGRFKMPLFGTAKTKPSEEDTKAQPKPGDKAPPPTPQGGPPPGDKDVEKGPPPKEKDKVKDDELLVYDPEDDVWALDEGKPSEGRKYARSAIEAFNPVMRITSLLGMFPLVAHRTANGTYVCAFSWASYPAILFIMCAPFCVCATLWVLFSIICISINFPAHPEDRGKRGDIYRSEEIYVYKRNVIALVIIICSFIHLTVCMIAVFVRKDYIAKQLIYWTEVVELLHLDVGKDVRRTLWKHIGIVGGFAALLIVFYNAHFSPGLVGAGSMFYIMISRVIDPTSLWHEKMHIRNIVCSSFVLFVIIGGYLYSLWFFYNCRILTNILKIWNNRFEFCLHKQVLEATNLVTKEEIREGTKAANRTSRGNLFKDHLVIFNLLEGVNTQFEVIMESYYLSTMIMIVFETYGIVHTMFYDEMLACGSRHLDVVPLILFLCMQMFMYIVITLEAAGVADEARHVLDIVRRKGMMSSRADNELWFMMSMRLSFGGHEDVGIIGAGFFYVTKAFLLGGISALMSHFIIFYQFEIPLSQTSAGDDNLDQLNITALLQQLENVKGTTC